MGGGGAPVPPDYEGAARGGIYADLETYPLRYLVDAAARSGGTVNIGGKSYDFTGLGDADNAAVMSDKMAQTLLDIQRGLGPQYIQQRLDELKQADPRGYAARQELFDRILADSQAHPNRPLAEDLQSSIVSQLTNAGKLDARELEQVQQQVRGGQVARNNFLGNAATAQEAGAAVKASDALKSQQQAQALGFLESGVTPEDVEYRRIQQSPQNLGSFISGQTPTAQFRSLSAAGNGAAPFIASQSNVTTNPNAGIQGINNAQQIYSGNINWQQSQVNPWTAGISTAISGAPAAYNAGQNAGWWGPPANAITWQSQAPAGASVENTPYGPG